MALQDIKAEPERIRPASSLVIPAQEDLDRAAEAMNTCEKVTILAGAGAAGAHQEMLEVAERLQAPIVHALRAPSTRKYLSRLIDKAADDDAVFIPDVGSPVIWASRYLTMNGKRRLVGSFAHGSMANAVSQSIGAQSAYPDRQIVALAGDGGLAMLMGELLTIAQFELPVKIVTYNNSSLNFVEVEMKSQGFVNFGAGLKNPNFADMVETLGLRGFRVESSDELPSAVPLLAVPVRAGAGEPVG